MDQVRVSGPESDDDRYKLIDYRELAEMLGVNVATARDIVAEGKIPLVKISDRVHRVRLSDAKKFIDDGGVRADG